jgi:3-methyladenine DNA glycosylase AlkD
MPDQKPDLAALPPADSPQAAAAYLDGVFEQLGNPTDAAGVTRFMPGMDRTYGVRIPVLRKVGKACAAHYGKDAEACRAISQVCWAYGTREHRMVACFILEPLKLDAAMCWKDGVAYLPGIQTWEDCDQLCSVTLGRALYLDPAYMDALETWVTDDNLWVRRAALVSTVYLRRSKLPAETVRALDARVLDLCAALLDDTEPYIRKAVDWAVREVLRRHYRMARAWLMAQAWGGLSRTAQTTLKKSAKKLETVDQATFLAALDG